MIENELNNHITEIVNFKLKWRFTEEEYDIIQENHLEQFKPLDSKGAKLLSEFIENNQLHKDLPFKRKIFSTIDKIRILEDNEELIKKWLYQRGLSFKKKVYLSWDNETALITSWKYVVKYWSSLFYGGSDDLTVIDSSLNWALLFFHENEIYFGTRENFQKEKINQENFTL